MKEFKVFENQSWFDLSMTLYGSSINAVELAMLNNHNVTEDLKAGQIIIYSESFEKNVLSLLSMAQNKSIPATAIDELTINIPVDYGIGEMQIESTFIVR